MASKSCFFIGHREASSEIIPALEEAIEQHILKYGVTEFIVGGYGGFDHIAASVVITAKKQYPGIALFKTLKGIAFMWYRILLKVMTMRYNR